MSVQSNSSHPALSHTDRLATQWQDFLLLIARLLMGWIFVQSGWSKLMNIAGFVATMPRRGLPDWLGYVAPPVEFVGGVLIIAGLATRYTALVMLLFVIIASFSSHRYWAVRRWRIRAAISGRTSPSRVGWCCCLSPVRDESRSTGCWRSNAEVSRVRERGQSAPVVSIYRRFRAVLSSRSLLANANIAVASETP
jgi:uncharacterized membrane protein YphA (DoxX/SURF4 family)